jgi:hypothetical protein
MGVTIGPYRAFLAVAAYGKNGEWLDRETYTWPTCHSALRGIAKRLTNGDVPTLTAHAPTLHDANDPALRTVGRRQQV